MTHRDDHVDPERTDEALAEYYEELRPEEVERAVHAADVRAVNEFAAAARDRVPTVAAAVAAFMILVLLLAVLVAS